MKLVAERLLVTQSTTVTLGNYARHDVRCLESDTDNGHDVG